MNDGRKFAAKLLGADPRLEIAVLKIKTGDLPFYDLSRSAKAEIGANVLALSNLFNVAVGDEPASVQHGVVSAIAKLGARRGAYETPYKGPVYILDVKTNNPGSAGGGLGRSPRRIAGNAGQRTKKRHEQHMAQLRNSHRGTAPIGRGDSQRKSSLPNGKASSAKKSSHPLTLEKLGIVLVPDVLERTPPFVEKISDGSPADKAGIRPDDLIVLLGDRSGAILQTAARMIFNISTPSSRLSLRFCEAAICWNSICLKRP